jgi:hypothetical protein
LKKLLLVVIVAILALAAVTPAFAEEEHICDHDGATIESLHHCVEHAAEMGHITKRGIVKSLLAKLNAAQAAYDSGDTAGALNYLNDFNNQVNAQTGKSIDAEHAGHLIEHAGNVIDALSA